MKTVKFFVYLLVVISTSLFTSCTTENLDLASTTKESITKSQWSVEYFFAGQDITAQFSNYKINFVGNGTVTANNGTTTVNGIWNMVTDLNRNELLRINVAESHLQVLNDEWTVKQTSDDVITMKGVASEIHLKKQ